MSIFKKVVNAVKSGSVGPLAPLKVAANAVGLKSVAKGASIGNQVSGVAMVAMLAGVGGKAAVKAASSSSTTTSSSALTSKTAVQLPSNLASTSKTSTLNKLAYGLGDVKNVVQTVSDSAQVVSNVAQGVNDGLDGNTSTTGVYVQTSWIKENMILVIGGCLAVLGALYLIFRKK